MREETKEVVSNYDKQREDARSLFLTYEQEPIIRKLSLRHDEAFLYLPMLDEIYRISRTTGEIDRAKGGEEGSPLGEWEPSFAFETNMTLYDVLCYSKENLKLSGEWCPVDALYPMATPSANTLFGRYGDYFAGRTEELNAACAAIGGIRQAVPASADASYRLAVFPFFPAWFSFWEGDDEFLSQVKVLWDKNALDYLHFETVYYALNHVLERLKRKMEEGE